jgi:glyoxylase-like metal-dependent hydrolase (beta-lactamase superfamily II)
MSFTILALYLASLTLATHPPSSPLQWSVFLNPPVPVVNPPQNYTWSPTAFTLIHGPFTALLVDAPITLASANALADWIESTIPGKKLTHNYITHGHGDHFFGSAVLQQRFPGLQIVATDRTLAHIEEQLLPAQFDGVWTPWFPDGQIPVQNETFTVLPRNGEFWVDGNVVRAVEVGQSDTYNTTVLHVPSLDLVVTGDVVYGECFQYLAESDTAELRGEWIKAVDEVEGLNPKIVVPSHKQAWDGYGTDHLEKTRDYLRTWGDLVGVAESASDMMERVTEAFPDRIGDFILEISAQAAFPSA